MNNLSKTETVADISIGDLILDSNNPRFGELAEDRRNQTDLLDFIVRTFGVNDLLSSLAVNGYFAAEPVVCKPEGEKFVVVEGNRRLAACLIILGDERAKNQGSLTKKYQSIHAKHKYPVIDPIPAITFDSEVEQRSLLSYLGVRHIAASKSWDSYAKAVWVSRIIKESGMALEDVAAMIGDEHRALARLLEGYHFIQQLIESDRFRPEDSNRRGRGSNTNYPFSWVYTILGYKSARRFLDIQDNTPENPIPIPDDKLDDAELLTKAMFGNRTTGTSAAVSDSRQLRQLALTLEDQEKVTMLKQGKSLEDIEYSTRPIKEFLGNGLGNVKTTLSDISGRLIADPPSEDLAGEFLSISKKVKNLAVGVDKSLREIASGENEN